MKKIISLLMLTLFSVSAHAGKLKRWVQEMDDRLTEVELIVMAQQDAQSSKSYVGGSLVDLDKFVGDNGMSLQVGSKVDADLIKKMHEVLQGCFDKITEDFPNKTFNFTEVRLHGNAKSKWGDVAYVLEKSYIDLFRGGTAQACYNAIYTKGLKDK
jgi:hypothetical protein